MSEALKKSNQTISGDSHNATSSPALADGPMRLGSQAGETRDLFGQAVVRVSRFRLRAKSKALATNGTFGPSGFASSESVNLSLCLGSRLRARLDTNGSPGFTLKWSRRGIRSGLRIFVLRAFRRNTLVNGCGLWRTPAARDWRDLSETGRAYAAARQRHQPSTVTLAYERGFVSSQIPELLCGLMGYPDRWVQCGLSAMQSFRKSRKHS